MFPTLFFESVHVLVVIAILPTLITIPLWQILGSAAKDYIPVIG